ncbi:MAG TPA: ferrochelatase [Steroidobacteraceae bacterium]|nr:ferrochelatase [Steroidobacteraceae bacterium]
MSRPESAVKKWGVLLVNSGTPASLATRDVRAFLAGLLGDPRVVELPRLLWWPILHGIILRVRPRASAKKYAAIWTPEGSPLAIESEALRRGLEASLRAGGTPVSLAMLYTGGASVPDAVASLRKAGAEGILVIPMFPQYCGASTGAVYDQVSAALGAMRHVPDFRFVSSYHDDAAYIDALAASVQDHRREFGATSHLLMSFHGVPERFVTQGDPYRAQCERTSTLLAQRLGLGADAWSLSFQSRFGRARWLQPYTSEVLAAMPGRGVKSVSVICPGFAADCLETLEEIGMENRDIFLAAGGEKYHYIAALNARADHVAALSALISRELGASSNAVAGRESACFG